MRSIIFWNIPENLIAQRTLALLLAVDEGTFSMELRLESEAERYCTVATTLATHTRSQIIT